MPNNPLRTKPVSRDGATVTIAPLTIDQVEEYVAPLEDLAGEKSAKIRSYELVCHGLNNALADGEPQWTHDRIRKELDLVLFGELQREILEFSGFKLDRKEAVAVPGESRAASDAASSPDAAGASSPASTSATSAAA